MNQFRIFWRLERKPLIGWSAGVGGFLLLMGLVYAGAGGGEGFAELWEQYPDTIKDFIPAADLSTAGGFVKVEAGTFFPLLFGIMLVMMMTKHLSGAEETGRLDHALARPVTRFVYYWHLHLAVLALYCAILLAALIGTYVGFAAELDGDIAVRFLGMWVEYIPLGIAFVGVGGLVGAAFHQRGKSNGLGIGIVVAFFAMGLIARLVDELDWLADLTPIGLHEQSDLYNGELDLAYTIVSLVVGILASVGGWIIFDRKNLYA